MILTEDELASLRTFAEATAGLDEELMQRCGDLMHIAAFDDAVLKAFVLLEERLRKIVDPGRRKLRTADLINYVFSQDGPLGKRLGDERDGMRDLYSGAFKVFRNPAAHGSVRYDPVKGKSIIGLVNLLLNSLKDVPPPPPPPPLPPNIESILAEFAQDPAYGTTVEGMLRSFIEKCIQAGIEPQAPAKQWIAFRRRALIKPTDSDETKATLMPVFYLFTGTKAKGLWFPVNERYRKVVGFDIKPIEKSLKGLGFQIAGKHQDYSIDLRFHNRQVFFDQLIELAEHIAKELDATLQSV